MKADRKEIILKAAAECFARYGYDKTTLDDIGKVVGLNKASLYYYYRNKEDLFTEVILLESSRYISSLQEKVQQLPKPEDKITEYLIERFRYYKHVINLHQLSLDTLRKVEPLFDTLYKQVLEKEIDFLRELVDKLLKKNNDNKQLAQSLLTIADGIKAKLIQNSGVQYANEIDYSKIEDEIRFVINIYLAGLKVYSK